MTTATVISPKRKLNQHHKHKHHRQHNNNNNHHNQLNNNQQQQQQQPLGSGPSLAMAISPSPSPPSIVEFSSTTTARRRHSPQNNGATSMAPAPITTVPRKTKGGSGVGNNHNSGNNRPLRHSTGTHSSSANGAHSSSAAGSTHTNLENEPESNGVDHNPSPAKKPALCPPGSNQAPQPHSPNHQRTNSHGQISKKSSWATRSAPSLPLLPTPVSEQAKTPLVQLPNQSSGSPILFNIAPSIPPPVGTNTFSFAVPSLPASAPSARQQHSLFFPPPWGKLSSSSSKTIEELSKEDPEFYPLLTEEIQQFNSWIVASPEERQAREGVVQRIADAAHRLWPKSSVKVIGSFATGLCLPTSDIDLVIVGAGETKRNGRFADPMEELASQLRRARVPSEMNLITRARVPIIKMTDAATNYKVDISFEVMDGVKNTELVRTYLSSSPLVQPLVLIIKFLLSYYKLNETFTGGIGSYALTLLVLFHVQMHPGLEAGELLTSFFYEFGFKFDYENTGISILGGPHTFSKKERGWFQAYQPFLLSLEDPALPENDVGRGSFNMFRIRDAFQNAYKELASAPPDFSYSHSLLGRILWPTPEMLRRLGVPSTPPTGRASGTSSSSLPPPAFD